MWLQSHVDPIHKMFKCNNDSFKVEHEKENYIYVIRRLVKNHGVFMISSTMGDTVSKGKFGPHPSSSMWFTYFHKCHKVRPIMKL